MEGLVQRQREQEKELDRNRGDSPAVSEQKRSIEAGQDAARQDMFAEINREQAAA